MKIVFGPVPAEHEEFLDEDSFKGLNGKPYYYELEVTEEEGHFRISDNCDRYMPFDFDNLDDLIRVLSLLRGYINDKKDLSTYWNNIWKAGK